MAAAPLVEVIRSFRPHVVTTYDENGGYPHPDHIMCHRDHGRRLRRGGGPACVPGAGDRRGRRKKLYYQFAFHRERIVALDRAMIQRGLESPYADRLRDWKPDPDHAARLTTRVPCADYFHIRDHALLAHATQVDPEGPWFSVPLEVHQAVWPTEDWQLVRDAGRHRDSGRRPVRRYRGRIPGDGRRVE